MPTPYQSPIAVDTHTHTVLSGHAWSTLLENIQGGRAHGLAGLVSTEHAFIMPGAISHFLPGSFPMLPASVEGFRLFYGLEFNILDHHGRIDPYLEKSLPRVQFGIASIHELLLPVGSVAQNTDAYIGAIENPLIDILGHPDTPSHPCDIPAVVSAVRQQNKLIEINNNSFVSRPGGQGNCLAFARECKKQGVRVSVASDAHFCTAVGRVEKAWEILKEVDFPPELIVNLTLERFSAYMDERRMEKEVIFAAP